MKTQYYTATSLDGFIADSENSLDWLMQFGEPPAESYSEFIKEVGAIVMGSTTYQWMLDNEIFKDPERPKPWPYGQPTWIFTSRKLQEIPSADIRFVQGDVRPVHKNMMDATNGKNIWVVGGGELAGQFLDHNLLDELIITITPTILGGGSPLLPRRIDKPPLKLISTKNYGESYVELRFEVQRN
ncbi:dihydrofolate reductase [bacterium]|nr:dihydrofolate reductase [bacterium]